MGQLSLGEAEFAGKCKVSLCERFLAEVDRATPWKVFDDLAEPHCPKTGNGLRPRSAGSDAVHPRHATPVQSVESDDGRGTLRRRLDSQFRKTISHL